MYKIVFSRTNNTIIRYQHARSNQLIVNQIQGQNNNKIVNNHSFAITTVTSYITGGCSSCARVLSSWSTIDYNYSNKFNYNNNWNKNNKFQPINAKIAMPKQKRVIRQDQDSDQHQNQEQQQQQQQQNNIAVNMSNTEKKNKSSFSKQYTDDKTGMIIIEEGSCSMCIAKEDQNDVFYNPVQVQNRDLSILMLQLYGERRQRRMIEDIERQRMKRLERQSKIEEEHKKQHQQEFVGESSQNEDESAAHNMETQQPPPTNEGNSTTNTNNESQVNSSDTPMTEVPKVKLEILDALAASGLRSMRYWKECNEIISHITINDIEPVAAQRALRNIEQNGLSDVLIPDTEPYGRPYGIRIATSDAIHVMYNSREKRMDRPNGAIKNLPSLPPEELSKFNWDVIDIDPYGSASPFIDSAVQAITNGGMLNVTCTDIRCLSGSHSPDAAFGRYGSIPIAKSQYFCESSVRMVLYSIAAAAARCGRTIKPILSVGMDFYLRVFVEVYDDKKSIRDVSLQVGMIYQSTQCPNFYTQPLGQLGGSNNNVLQPTRVQTGVCTETGTPLKMAGPIWLGPLHDQDVIKAALDRLGQPSKMYKKQKPLPHESPTYSSNRDSLATRERLIGLLTSCLEELPDCPLYYKLDDLTRCMHMSQPPLLDFKSAIVNAGYKVSGYHKEPQAIKTNAPSSVIWDIVRAWVKRRPLGKPPQPGSVAEQILNRKSSIEVEFNRPKVISDTKVAHSFVKRFPMNPEENWGPKGKANPRNKKRMKPDE